MAGYWPRSFFASLWTSTSSRSINTQKKYPAILTSYLVNNPYILIECVVKSRPIPIVLVKCWKVAHWIAKKLLKNCQKSKKLLPKFQKLLPKFLAIFI